LYRLLDYNFFAYGTNNIQGIFVIFATFFS